MSFRRTRARSLNFAVVSSITAALVACDPATTDDSGMDPDPSADDDAAEDPSAQGEESTPSNAESSAHEDSGDDQQNESQSGEESGETDETMSSNSSEDSGDASGSGEDGDSSESGDIDPNTDPLADLGEVRKLAGGFQFLEGPVWRDEPGTLLFSDIPADTIYEWREGSEPTVFRGPTNPPSNANGLMVDPSGILYVCEHSTHRVARYRDGAFETALAETYMGLTLNSPNDLVRHENSTIYFSDPTWGGTGEVGTRGVYRIDPEGKLHQFVARQSPIQPNGVALSPKMDRIYLSDSIEGTVHAFDLDAEGVPSNERLFAQTGGGGDGMAVDVLGNLYVAVNAGVLVLRPSAEPWGTISFPEEPANCSFGGETRRTLFVTARTGLYAVDVQVPGLPPTARP